MTSTIFSPQHGHVGPVAPDKMTTVISDHFCSPWHVPHEILGPHFGPPLDLLSVLIIVSHAYVTIFSQV